MAPTGKCGICGDSIHLITRGTARGCWVHDRCLEIAYQHAAAPVPDAGVASPHTEPCGCVYESFDLPDDQWIGQGWRRISACDEHGEVLSPCVSEHLRPRRRVAS